MSPLRVPPAIHRRWRRLSQRGRTVALGRVAKVLRALRPGAATETRLLRWSWVSRDAQRLDEYLVIGWQNPRINLQSILVRHALLRRLFGSEFDEEMAAELRFAIELNEVLRQESLRTGVPISTSLEAERQARILEVTRVIAGREREFQDRWRATLVSRSGPRLSVLELACGSANDYRAFHDFGLAQFLDYVGIDLNPKNVANAQRRFPSVRFEAGNAMETKQPDRSFDVVIVSDLFEHLPIPLAAQVLAEATRVARHAAVLSFFNMAELPEHDDRPVAAYHWNLLSRARYEEALQSSFANVSVTPIGAWLKAEFDHEHTFNRGAYTIIAQRD